MANYYIRYPRTAEGPLYPDATWTCEWLKIQAGPCKYICFKTNGKVKVGLFSGEDVPGRPPYNRQYDIPTDPAFAEKFEFLYQLYYEQTNRR